MIWLKLLLVPGLVALVTLAVRRWGPAVGGWLAGLPIVAGPVLVFYALEQGNAFAARAAHATLAGLIATVAFAVVYAQASGRFPWYLCMLLGWVVFAVAILALYFTQPGLVASLLVLVAATVLGRRMLRRVRFAEPGLRTQKNAEPGLRTQKNGEPGLRTQKNGEPGLRTQKNGEPGQRTQKNGEPGLRTQKNAEPGLRTQKNAEPGLRTETSGLRTETSGLRTETSGLCTEAYVGRVPPKADPPGDLSIRLVATATLVLVLTGLASRLGPAWSGLLNAFPVLTTIVAVFSHAQRGAAATVAFLNGYLQAIPGFGLFCVVMAIGLESLGLGWALAAALAVQIAWHAILVSRTAYSAPVSGS